MTKQFTQVLWLCLLCTIVHVLVVNPFTSYAQTTQCNWDGSYSLTPLLNPQANPWLQGCINDRCVITTNSLPTIPSTDTIACNNDWNTEANANCEALQAGYNEFFHCVYLAVANDNTPLSPNDQNSICIRVQSQSFIRTPGFPYHMTNLTQYATNYFVNDVSPNLNLNVNGNNRCPTLPAQCCLQSPLSTNIYDDGKYYNYILCGIGCKTGLFLMAFTIISLSMFVCCGLCWPAPSLKQTAKQWKEEEAAAAACQMVDSDSEPYSSINNNINNITNNYDNGNVLVQSTVYLQDDADNSNMVIYTNVLSNNNDTIIESNNNILTTRSTTNTTNTNNNKNEETAENQASSLASRQASLNTKK